MKIGSAITFLLLALIALGYLLSENVNALKELGQLRQQIAQLINEREAFQERLNIANTKITELSRQFEQLMPYILSLQKQVRQLQEENQTLKNQNAYLQQQIAQMNTRVPLSDYLTTALSSPLSLAIFLPVIPLSAVATYVLVRPQKHTNKRKNLEVHSTAGQRMIRAQLTEEEMKQIIKMRRGR